MYPLSYTHSAPSHFFHNERAALTGGGLYAASIEAFNSILVDNDTFSLNNNVAISDQSPNKASVALSARFQQGRAPRSTVAMSGADLCADAGCVVEVIDGFGQLAATPALVELTIVDGPGTIEAPRLIPVDGGRSLPFSSVRIVLAPSDGGGDAGIDPVDIKLGLVLGIRIAVTDVVVGPCGPGHGADADTDEGITCVPCEVGKFAGSYSWNDCETCAVGTSTNSTASLACAISLTTTGVDMVVLIITAVLAVVELVALVVSCLRDRSASHGAIGTVFISVCITWGVGKIHDKREKRGGGASVAFTFSCQSLPGSYTT